MRLIKVDSFPAPSDPSGQTTIIRMRFDTHEVTGMVPIGDPVQVSRIMESMARKNQSPPPAPPPGKRPGKGQKGP